MLTITTEERQVKTRKETNKMILIIGIKSSRQITARFEIKFLRSRTQSLKKKTQAYIPSP